MNKPERWHVGKEIPIAVIVGLMAQAAAIVWFGAQMDARIEAGALVGNSNAASIVGVRRDLRAVTAEQSVQAVAIERLTVTLESVDKSMDRIGRALDKLE